VASPALVVSSSGDIGITGTMGTSYRIETTTSLKTGTWVGVSTNTIISPAFNLIVSKPTNGQSIFYRAVWLNR
jgi:hypothetical protein